MRLVIATAGSRGDVQPYIALGLGLQAAGHEVTLTAGAEYASFVAEHGLAFAPLRQTVRQAYEDCVDRLDNPATMLRWLKAHFTPDTTYFSDLLAAMRGHDAALIGFLAFPAVHVAEALSIAWLGAFLQPWTPSRAFTWALPVRLPPWLPDSVRSEINWWSSRSASLLVLRAMRAAVDEGRREVLGLAPVPDDHYATFGSAEMPVIYGYSRHLVPEQPAWTPLQRVTGFWGLAGKGWQPPAELTEFLAAGAPPVVVGFGSMADCQARQVTQVVVRALATAGQRGILLGGWAGLGEGEALPETILRLDEAPHDWLLPRAAAMVHHGGAGTTAAALRAGIPSLVVPYFGDQRFWGERLHRLGVAPQPIPRRALSVDRLEHGLRQAASRDMRECAAEARAMIAAEDGIGTAVAAIEDMLH